MGPILFQFYIYIIRTSNKNILYDNNVLYHAAIMLNSYLRCISRLDAKTTFARCIQNKVGFGATYTFLSRHHKWSNLVYILRLPKRVVCGNRTVFANIPRIARSDAENIVHDFAIFTVFLQLYYFLSVFTLLSYFSSPPPSLHFCASYDTTCAGK